MHRPLVSVVLSVYNGERYLAEAIESILAQSYEDFEFIILDDGSTDRSLEIIKGYEDMRIQCISRENKGLVYSLNEGILLAKGKYIARMDADDISLRERLMQQVSFMETHPDVGICGTAVMVFGENTAEHLWRLNSSDETIKTELLFSSSLAHPTVMMRREVIERYHLWYDPAFQHAEDYELWSRFAQYTKMANLKVPLLRYRVVENSISRMADKDAQARYMVMKKIPEKFMQQLGIDRDVYQTRLHFNLSTNVRMQEQGIGFESLAKYFALLLKANKQKSVFSHLALRKVLGKKWLVNLFYRKEAGAIFSMHTFYGIWAMITK